MSILFRKVTRDRTIEVRGAGQSRRLYVDGVLHTQYNPRTALSGGIWDPLALAAFLAPPSAIERVLLLGLGGGAAVHLLDRYVRPKTIVAVDIEPLHVELADRFFGVTSSKDRQIIVDDALAWVADYDGPRFQMIIDDLCGEERGEPRRAISPGPVWTRKLLRILDPERGVVVINAFTEEEITRSPLFRSGSMTTQFPSAYRLRDPRFLNVMGAASTWEVTPRTFWRRIQDALTERGTKDADDAETRPPQSAHPTRPTSCQSRRGSRRLWRHALKFRLSRFRR